MLSIPKPVLVPELGLETDRQTDRLYIGHKRLPQESGFSPVGAHLYCTDFLWKADISLYSTPVRVVDVG